MSTRVKASNFHKDIELPNGTWVSRLKCRRCLFWRDGFEHQDDIVSCPNCGLFMQLVGLYIVCWHPSGEPK